VLYKTASLEILAPDSEYLESIGHNILKDMAEMESHQLHNQIVLLENLLININHDINLPARAVTGLADVFCKVQDYFGEITKIKSLALKIKNRAVFCCPVVYSIKWTMGFKSI